MNAPVTLPGTKKGARKLPSSAAASAGSNALTTRRGYFGANHALLKTKRHRVTARSLDCAPLFPPVARHLNVSLSL